MTAGVPGDVLPVPTQTPERRRPGRSLPRPHLRPIAGPGGLIRSAIDLALLVVVLALAVTSAILIYGFVSSGGSQPGQLLPQASPSFGLMPMGNAHIPTTNACVLCHTAGGDVKEPPVILHPIEGWRRCLTCHTNEALGRTAPGHEGIAETECLNCHKTGQAGPAITQPHAVLHDQHCLDCHGSVAHLPSTMASSNEADCVLCHKPAALPPPSYPHAASVYLDCRSCHQSAEVGALPIDHARRTDDTCLLCHEINVVGASSKPAPLPTVRTSPGSLVPATGAPLPSLGTP
ncbi:MAG TPA: hypothetical protein VFP19_06425 [Candidatus Limnocylindrales bacterium]|nr:hypothetical protein [Candidatus Limnocylindrales bacterium]